MLFVHEIFKSIQGETTLSGFSSCFIRLAGCNLDCTWCDTSASKEKGSEHGIGEVLDTVKGFLPFHHVTLTGGEPLLQENTLRLHHELLNSGFTVQIETNGSCSIEPIPAKVRRIVDIKTPSSGAAGSFYKKNIGFLTQNDELKLVVSDRDDFRFAKTFLAMYQEDIPCIVNLTPTWKSLSPGDLATWMLEENLNARINLQIHKYMDIP